MNNRELKTSKYIMSNGYEDIQMNNQELKTSKYIMPNGREYSTKAELAISEGISITELSQYDDPVEVMLVACKELAKKNKWSQATLDELLSKRHTLNLLTYYSTGCTDAQLIEDYIEDDYIKINLTNPLIKEALTYIGVEFTEADVSQGAVYYTNFENAAINLDNAIVTVAVGINAALEPNSI